MAKVALHIAGVTLARDFKQIGIPVGLIHPGVVSFRSHYVGVAIRVALCTYKIANYTVSCLVSKTARVDS